MATAAIINDTSGTGHFGCDLVMRQLRHGLAAAGIETVWTHPVGKDWRPIAHELLARPVVDVVVVNGEGSIHHSAARDRARYLPAFAPFAKARMSVPVFLINSTIYEIDEAVADDLRRFDAIFVRDRGSADVLERFDLASMYVPDLTVGAPICAEQQRRGICVTDSVVKEIARDLDGIAARNGWETRKMHLKNRGISRLLPWTRKPPDLDEFVGYLASHELVVTGRYHTATMCLATGTPFVAIESNTPKISWLLDDVFGDRKRLLTADKLKTRDLSEFTSWSAGEAIAVDEVIARARAGYDEMFATIAAAVPR